MSEKVKFRLYVHCDLGLGDITLGQGHITLLGHCKQLCEVSYIIPLYQTL